MYCGRNLGDRVPHHCKGTMRKRNLIFKNRVTELVYKQHKVLKWVTNDELNSIYSNSVFRAYKGINLKGELKMKDKTVPAFELNLKPVNGDGKKKDPKAKVEEALENIKMLISKQQEMQDVFAKVTRTKFESLRKAGFTKDEALFLCK